jgi:hypothetical protein
MQQKTPCSRPCIASLNPFRSSKVQQHQETKCYEYGNDYGVSSLLGAYPLHYTVYAGQMRRRYSNSPVDAGQGFPLQIEGFVDSVGLAQHSVRNGVGLVYPIPLIQHVICLLLSRICLAIGLNVGPHIRQQVCSLACRCDVGLDPRQFSSMLGKHFPMARKIVLLQRRRCESRLRIQQPR